MPAATNGYNICRAGELLQDEMTATGRWVRHFLLSSRLRPTRTGQPNHNDQWNESDSENSQRIPWKQCRNQRTRQAPEHIQADAEHGNPPMGLPATGQPLVSMTAMRILGTLAARYSPHERNRRINEEQRPVNACGLDGVTCRKPEQEVGHARS